jgi:hypothetical protein
LAALNARRPTRDIDFAAQAIDNDTNEVLRLVRQIDATAIEDGIEFDAANAIAKPFVTTTLTADCASRYPHAVTRDPTPPC